MLVNSVGQNLTVDDARQRGDGSTHTANMIVLAQLERTLRQHACDLCRVAHDQRRGKRLLFAAHLRDGGDRLADVHHGGRVDLLGARQFEEEADAGVVHPRVENALFLQ